MSYANFLAKTIQDSGLSLRAIATLCEKKYNVKITASYLSKLQKEGNKNPASEKVNSAVAKVCGINPDDLIFEADLEKAPETVKETINELIEFIRKFILKSGESFSNEDKEIELNFQSQINKCNKMSNRELMQYIAQFSTLEDKENPFEQGFDLNGDNIEDLLMKFSINIPMEDNSMFPIIKQGAKIELVKMDEYSNGDIVSVVLNNEKSLIRTYVDSGKNAILIPANQDFETITVPKKDIEIKGKVKSYTIEL